HATSSFPSKKASAIDLELSLAKCVQPSIMRRILFHILCSLSLLLCLTSILFWYRSHHITSHSLKIADSINIRKTSPRYWIVTHPNNLTLCRQVGKNWDHPLKEFKFLGVRFGGLWGQNSMLWNLIIPFWLLTTLTAILPLFEIPLLIRAFRKSLRDTHGLCLHCGYDLRASPERCPECGQPASSIHRRVDSLMAAAI
ncbi:MAG TPA: hypothetical protein VGP94_01080, partial [Tepidisphaeraceae bacterium]|nr:hypothetical protein [Tepidisphaeraceae bacterium]